MTFANPFYNWQTGAALSSAHLPVCRRARTAMLTYYPAPGVAQYSLGVQREIVPSLILMTQYVGNLAWHQNVDIPDQHVPAEHSIWRRVQLAAQANSPARKRQWPGRSLASTESTEETNIATGSYNSFQLDLRQQSRHGLSFEVDYTYAHEIDCQVGSSDLNTGASNPFNLKYDKGSGYLDRRQILNMNYMYQIPLFAHSNGLAHSILGGWEISGTVISQSGLPWAGSNTPGNGGSDTVGLGGNYTNRPNFSRQGRIIRRRETPTVFTSGFPNRLLAADGSVERRSEPGLRQRRQGRCCRSRPHQLRHQCLQVVCVYRARTL